LIVLFIVIIGTLSLRTPRDSGDPGSVTSPLTDPGGLRR